MPLTSTPSLQANVLVLGGVRGSPSPETVAALMQLLDRTPAGALVLDLEHVDDLDETILRRLARWSEEHPPSGLALVAPPRRVVARLHELGLWDTLHVTSDLDNALFVVRPAPRSVAIGAPVYGAPPFERRRPSWRVRPVTENAVALELSGTFDDDAVPLLEQLFSELEANGTRRTVLDLAEVNALSLTTRALFIRIDATWARHGGAGLALVKVPSALRGVVDPLGLIVAPGVVPALTTLAARPEHVAPERAVPVYGAPPIASRRAEPALAPPPARTAPVDDRLLVCTSCNRHYRESETFCPFCGDAPL
jgi:anti-anti-sigma regulatory factor